MYKQLEVKANPECGPAYCVDNFFFFPDGLQIIISKEELPTGAVKIHVSSSLRPNTSLYSDMRLLRGKVDLVVYFREITEERVKQLDPQIKLNYLFMSANLVPHWYANLPEEPVRDDATNAAPE